MYELFSMKDRVNNLQLRYVLRYARLKSLFWLKTDYMVLDFTKFLKTKRMLYNRNCPDLFVRGEAP